MKKIAILFILFSIGSVLLAQNALPTEGLMHHFTFNDPSNLEAAEIGNDLIRDAHTDVEQVFNAVNGPSAGNGAVEVGIRSFYRLNLDFEANDGEQRINKFAFVIDFYLPMANAWYCFHSASNEKDENGNKVPIYGGNYPDRDDWESFVRPSGILGVGATGYSIYRVPEKEWHRLVITADLGNYYNYYLDGQLLRVGGAQELDGRLSLPSIDDVNQILLFGDNDGEDANIYIAELGIYNRPLTSDEIWAMGGYGHSIPLETPIGLWNFDDPSNLTAAFYGNDLKLTGVQTAVEGPESYDGAVMIDKGSYYTVKHDIAKNGGGEKVNEYTLAIDLKFNEAGKTYSLFQTDLSNSSNGELIINSDSQLGDNDLGFTDSSLVAGDWYRMVMVARLDSMVKIYLDGDSVLLAGDQVVDNRFSVSPRELENAFLLFADNDGDDNNIDIASVTFYNRVLAEDEIMALGGFEHGALNTEVTGGLKSVYFNGTEVNNKYARITKTNDDFNFGEGDFTIETWVKPDISYSSDPCILSDKAWTSGSNAGWVISTRGDDWKFNAADADGNRYDIEAPKINDGNWHHIAVICKQDSGIKLITDDLETIWATDDGDFFNVGSIDNPDLPLCIAQDGTEQYPDGPPAPVEVDEMRIYKGVAIEPEVIKSWRNKEVNNLHPYYSNLVAYYKFNEEDGDIIKDHSGHNHDAEMVGYPKRVISYAAVGNNTVQNMNDVTALWGANSYASSTGLQLSAEFPDFTALLLPTKKGQSSEMLVQAQEDNPFVVFAHNGKEALTTSGVPTGVEARYARVWYLNSTETTIQGGSFTFKFSDYNGSGNAGEVANYVLLKSSSVNGSFVEVAGNISVADDEVTISGIEITDGYYTVASKDLTASPLGGLVVGVEDNETGLPKEFSLGDNYPNPFNPSTTIRFALPVASKVRLTIFNVLGQAVQELVNNELQAGVHTYQWDSLSKAVSSGIYFYNIVAVGNNGREFISTKKMMLLK